jgi:hypothetical protein
MVFHQLLDKNLNKLEVPTRLRNLIMGSYKSSLVRIWSVGSASRHIDIKKGVKQRYPLSPLLFNICRDSLISYLRKASDLSYDTDGLSSSLIKA